MSCATAGPASTTITQVTPAVRAVLSVTDSFDTALLNIFSATCKPLSRAAFLRGVRQRFRVVRYEAHTQGPAGLFRPDMPETLKLEACDQGVAVRSRKQQLCRAQAHVALALFSWRHHAVFNAEELQASWGSSAQACGRGCCASIYVVRMRDCLRTWLNVRRSANLVVSSLAVLCSCLCTTKACTAGTPFSRYP